MGECLQDNITSEEIKINIIVKADKNSCRWPKGKRQLSGKCRLEIGQLMIDHNKTAHKEIKENMEGEPPKLFSAGVLRKAKQDVKEMKIFNQNLLLSLEELTTSFEYADIKFFTGLNPMFVMYFSQMQFSMCKRLAAQNTPFILTIDATGRIAQNIKGNKRPFLYQMVSGRANDIPQIPLGQMISTCHDTVSIDHWLKRWLQGGGVIPNVVVADGAKALLNAISIAFANLPSYKVYCEKIYICLLEKTLNFLALSE